MQTLTELTTLNADEQKNLSVLCALIDKGHTKILVSILASYSLAQLFKLAHNTKKIHDFLAGSQCDNIWHSRFKEVWPSAGGLELQDGSSVFDRLMSYFLLVRYLEYKAHSQGESKAAKELLKSSCNYGNFHAMRIWLAHKTQQLDKLTFSSLQKYILVLDSMASRHSTPGCLEAAYGYVKLGQFFASRETGWLASDLPITARFCFMQAIELTLVAEQLCETPAAQLAIKNAYADNGLLAAYDYQCKDFTELRSKIFNNSNLTMQEYIHCIDQSSTHNQVEQPRLRYA
jgi:hypothetical protein